MKKAVTLCLLTVGFTQHSVGQIRPTLHESVQSYQNVFASDTTAANLIWQPFDGMTIVRQAGSGLFFGGLAGAAGMGIGFLTNPSGASGLEALAFPIYLGLGVSSVGLVYGVQSAGDAGGGNGNLGGTILGTLAGGGVAVLSAVFFPDTESGRVMKGVGVAVGSLGGPILGYHLSATSVFETENAGSKVSLTLMPQSDHRWSGIHVNITF